MEADILKINIKTGSIITQPPIPSNHPIVPAIKPANKSERAITKLSNNFTSIIIFSIFLNLYYNI